MLIKPMESLKTAKITLKGVEKSFSMRLCTQKGGGVPFVGGVPFEVSDGA